MWRDLERAGATARPAEGDVWDQALRVEGDGRAGAGSGRGCDAEALEPARRIVDAGDECAVLVAAEPPEARSGAA